MHKNIDNTLEKIDFFTAEEMAAILRYKTPNSLKNLLRLGRVKDLPPALRVGRRFLFEKKQFYRWLNERQG